MTEPLSLEGRVHALELALTASEQWNVCVCGHHGSAHDPFNRCLVCECRHFGTRRPANTQIRELTAEDVAAVGRALAFVKVGKRMTGSILMKERTTLFTAMWEAAGAITDADLARLDRILAAGAARTEGQG